MEKDWFNFDGSAESAAETLHQVPLAARMRPGNLDEYAGQRHLLGQGKLLRRAIDADKFSSILLFGPPGTGKTSLAELIARMTDSYFVRLSGVTSSVADVRKAISEAAARLRANKQRTVLFIDEIHRFNKAQQDSLLPDVENGTVRLIGATTQNVQFYVVPALVSRSLVFQLQPLSEEDLRTLLKRAISDERGLGSQKIEAAQDALDFWAKICEGDARRALNALEIAAATTPPDADGVIRITRAVAADSIQRKTVSYGDDEHYDAASAFIKSMRGSDPDAAVYYLARMLDADGDIRFIARRIVILASEDIGNADPRALSVAVAAMQAVDMIGMPEARIILAQAVTYCATAPKSNAAVVAIDEASKDVRESRVQEIPAPLRDPHSAGGKSNKDNPNGKGYLYPHSFGGFVAQSYMTEPKSYYRPVNIGYEQKIRERMDYWKKCRGPAASEVQK